MHMLGYNLICVSKRHRNKRMALETEKRSENANSAPTSVEKTKTTRHPRWTRQETLVLIEAKKVVENEKTEICKYTSMLSIPGTATVVSEPKWEMVSSFCKNRGVNRGAFQCRKRWSNLVGDFKKIKIWESSKKEEEKCFWVMTKDERKENKLPGFFDDELYNVLEGRVCTSAAAFPLMTSIDMRSRAENDAGEEEEETEDEATEEEIIILENTTRKKVITPLDVLSASRGKIMKESVKEMPKNPLPTSGNNEGSSRGKDGVSEGGLKRKRSSPDNCEDTTGFNHKIVKAMKKNNSMLKAHLGAQNINLQLEREQKKEQTNSLVAALGKLTDALTKIADKL